jgi:hypothetical protein
MQQQLKQHHIFANVCVEIGAPKRVLGVSLIVRPAARAGDGDLPLTFPTPVSSQHGWPGRAHPPPSM